MAALRKNKRRHFENAGRNHPGEWRRYINCCKERYDWLCSQQTLLYEIESFDNLKLKAVYLSAEKPSKKILISIHGYKGGYLLENAVSAPFFREFVIIYFSPATVPTK